MRKKVILGNWKMNKNIDEAVAFCEEFKQFAIDINKLNVVVGVASTYLCLPYITKYASSMMIAAQNCHFEEKGAFTGEVSHSMLKSVGINACIIGHSERRKYDNETSVKCNKKIKVLLADGIVPVYCVGETLEEYEAGKTKEIVETQVKEGLEGLTEKDFDYFVIAYEPVWSIGTGRNASVEIAEDVCKFVRDCVEKYVSKGAAEKVIIQYGGSVKTNNAYEYLHSPNIDGVLVGGASLEVNSFKELAHKALD